MQPHEQRQRLVFGRLVVGVEAQTSLVARVVGHGHNLAVTDIDQVLQTVRRLEVRENTPRWIAVLRAVLTSLDSRHCRRRIDAGQRRSDLRRNADGELWNGRTTDLSFEQFLP